MRLHGLEGLPTDRGLRLVLVEGAPELRMRARDVEPDEDVENLALALRTTCEAAGGLGLSAPQIGVSVRMLYAGEKIYVNPRATFSHGFNGKPRMLVEGCLSLPGVRAMVPRFEHSYVSSDRRSDNHLSRQESQVFQHELDHLNGVLITDRGVRIGPVAWRSPWGKLVPERFKDGWLVYCPGCGHSYPWKWRLGAVQAMCFSSVCAKKTEGRGMLLDVLGWRPWRRRKGREW